MGYKGVTSDINKTDDYREILSKNLVYELENEEFKGHSKSGPKGVFSRDRKLTFKNLIVIIIIFKSSIQRELDRFFKIVNQSDFNIREVTKGALSQARAKLKPLAFKRLNEVACNTFYTEAAFLIKLP